jgi:hypothetical protein
MSLPFTLSFFYVSLRDGNYWKKLLERRNRNDLIIGSKVRADLFGSWMRWNSYILISLGVWGWFCSTSYLLETVHIFVWLKVLINNRIKRGLTCQLSRSSLLPHIHGDKRAHFQHHHLSKPIFLTCKCAYTKVSMLTSRGNISFLFTDETKPRSLSNQM